MPCRVLSIALLPLTCHLFGLLDVLAVPRLRSLRYLFHRVIEVGDHSGPLQRDLFLPRQLLLHELLRPLLLLNSVFLLALDLLVDPLQFLLSLVHCILSHLLKSIEF